VRFGLGKRVEILCYCYLLTISVCSLLLHVFSIPVHNDEALCRNDLRYTSR